MDTMEQDDGRIVESPSCLILLIVSVLIGYCPTEFEIGVGIGVGAEFAFEFEFWGAEVDEEAGFEFGGV
jgi:hypothetical protein